MIIYKLPKIRIALVVVALVLWASSSAAEYFMSNFNVPYDITFRVPSWPRKDGKPERFILSNVLEIGSTEHSYSSCTERAPLLEIYQPSESTLAMLMGAPKNSCATALIPQLAPGLAMLGDDGCRGHVKFFGKYHEWNYNIFGHLNFRIPTIDGNFYTELYIPIRHRSFTDIHYDQLTNDVLSSDLIVREFVTDLFNKHICEITGLSLAPQSKTGIGDIVFMAGWFNDFLQVREGLETVRITGRMGLSCPTGAKRNQNQVFSVDMGNDGAWAVPVALAIDLTFKYHFKCGLEFQMIKIFDKIDCRRVKTNRCQTDLLLPVSAETRKHFAYTWKFNLYGGLEHFISGFSAYVNYQFQKRSEDTLFPHDTNCFNQDIMNSAATLDDWNMHNFIFQLQYDPYVHEAARRSWFKPQFMFFYKLPVAGRRVLAAHTIAAQFSLSF